MRLTLENVIVLISVVFSKNIIFQKSRNLILLKKDMKELCSIVGPSVIYNL